MHCDFLFPDLPDLPKTQTETSDLCRCHHFCFLMLSWSPFYGADYLSETVLCTEAERDAWCWQNLSIWRRGVSSEHTEGFSGLGVILWFTIQRFIELFSP